MRFALSTNWCNRRLTTGEEIADRAKSLGFDALELGFHTTDQQVKGFKARLDEMPIGTVHAFCPVPISAPQGYPELYSLASFDKEARAMARFHVLKNVRFAAEMGADAVVLHLGRVMCEGFISRLNTWRRIRRGCKLSVIAQRELSALVPELEKLGVHLFLENLPYVEGFPAEWEMAELCGEWVRPWLDTGHDYVRRVHRWDRLIGEKPFANAPQPYGLHLNDSTGGDDHLEPGAGEIDFASLKEVACAAHHLVLEPNESIPEGRLVDGLNFLKNLWN